MSSKIDDIHTTVVTNKTNMRWVRKLMIIIIGLFFSSGAVYGYQSLSDGTAASAKEIVKVIDDKEP